MLVLVEGFDFDLDFGVNVIHFSLGGPCEVKLDEMDQQVCNLRG